LGALAKLKGWVAGLLKNSEVKIRLPNVHTSRPFVERLGDERADAVFNKIPMSYHTGL
jgi:hypothetical protein